MNKTKKIAMMVVIFATAFTSGAQGLYFGFGGGYGFGTNKTGDYNSTVVYSSGGNTETIEDNAYSLGKGINVGGYFGYMMNPNIGFELGASYLLGSKHTSTSSYSDQSWGYASNDELVFKGSMIRLVPTMRMTVGDKKFKPYFKAGLIMGVGSKVVLEYTEKYTSFGSSGVDFTKFEYTGGLSWGFHGAFGLNYDLNGKMSLFAEFAGNFQSWAMKKGEMIEYTEDGVSMMSGLTTSDKEVEFLKDYTETGTYNPGEPSKSPREFLPFSSIGINIGLNITLGK